MIFKIKELSKQELLKLKKLVLSNQCLGYLGFMQTVNPNLAAFVIIGITSNSITIRILDDNKQGTKLQTLLNCGWKPACMKMQNNLGFYLDNGLIVSSASINESLKFEFYNEQRFYEQSKRKLVEAVVISDVISKTDIPKPKTKKQIYIDSLIGEVK